MNPGTKLVLAMLLFAGSALVMFQGIPAFAQQAPAAAPATGTNQADIVPVAQGTQAASHPAAESMLGGQDFPFLRTFGGLVLVVCLIIAGYAGGRKLFPQYFAKPSAVKHLKLLETLTMGDKRSLALIRVDDKTLLVGNTPHQITLIATLSGSLTLAEASDVPLTSPLAASIPKTNGDSFRNLYDVEKKQISRGTPKVISPDVRAKMRQLREALEH